MQIQRPTRLRRPPAVPMIASMIASGIPDTAAIAGVIKLTHYQPAAAVDTCSLCEAGRLAYAR